MTNDNNTVLNTVVKKTLPIKKIREDKIIPKKTLSLLLLLLFWISYQKLNLIRLLQSTMGLASVIHPGMPRVSLSPKWTRLQLSHHHILTISTPTGLSLSLSHSLRVYFVLQYSLNYQKSFWILILQSVIIVAEPNIFQLLAPEEPSRRIIYLPQVNNCVIAFFILSDI